MVEAERTLGFIESYAIGLGTMIAAGIFSLSGIAVSAVGSSAILSFIIAACIAGITAAAYSEFASIYSQSGGGYLFVSKTFNNDYLVYIEGVMLFLGYNATTAFYLATFGEWFHQFIFSPIPPWLAGVVVATILGVLNARGTEESGTFQVIVTALKVLVLLIFVSGVFLYKPPGESVSTFVTSFVWDAPDIFRIAGLAFITFFGFSAIAASAGEIRKPRKTVPLAIGASILTVTLLYSLVIFAMVNSPVPAEVIANQGETAMGRVAEAYLGKYGLQLIVAGALFSMASASNASILAASRIGFLMGKEGRAFRRLQNIHPKFGTPRWSVGLCTITINLLIFLFMALFPSHNNSSIITLGLDSLTGFATTNLLLPLTVVNVALIYSRLKGTPEDRPFKLPFAKILPIVGIFANLYLVTTLPIKGIITGIIGAILFVIIYSIWGESFEPIENIMDRTASNTSSVNSEEGYNIVIPILREENIKSRLKFAQKITTNETNSNIKVITVNKVKDQVPTDAVDRREVNEFVDKTQDIVSELGLESNVDVEGYVSSNVAFTILQVARESLADLIILGYPNEQRKLAIHIQKQSPCDTLFVSGNPEENFETLNIGAGEGPHHTALLEFISRIATNEQSLHVIRVLSTVSGTDEGISTTVEKLSQSVENIEAHTIQSHSVAKGLVEKAEETRGTLFVGTSRDSLIRQWVFGSTPDRVFDLANEKNIPVVIYSGGNTLIGKIETIPFLIYRFIAKQFGL